jgi:hypothetical protein
LKTFLAYNKEFSIEILSEGYYFAWLIVDEAPLRRDRRGW